jgi:hypothetical protein
MSRPRFLADEDLRGSIVRAVRQLAPHLDIVTVIESHLTSISDEEVLEWAWDHGWLVVSHDVSTMKAAAERRIFAGKEIHGLFLAPQWRTTRVVAESLILLGEASEFEEWRNRIVYLPI